MSKPFDGEYIFRPANLKLKAGDLVSYWATAEDNKEPRPNQSETAHRTIRILGRGQNGQQDPQNQQRPDGQKQPNENKTGQNGERNKTEKGEGDPSSKSDGSKDDKNTSGDKSDSGGQGSKTQESQSGDGKRPGSTRQ